MRYAIGLDYGTNSYRCVNLNTANGEEVGTAIYEYETGDHDIILDNVRPQFCLPKSSRLCDGHRSSHQKGDSRRKERR